MIDTVSRIFVKIFGSRNERLVKSYLKRVELINELESSVRQLTDGELRAKTAEFRDRRRQGESVPELLPQLMAVAREVMDRSVGIRNIFNPAHAFDRDQLPGDHRRVYDELKGKMESLDCEPVTGGRPAPGWMQVDIPVSLYEAVRAIYPQSKPPFRARPFDVQLIGGMVLGEGRIAEMKTGEGKTIVAPLACYVACIDNLQCHVVTVNDYLVQRDRDWVFPFYYHLGLTVGAIHPMHMQEPEGKKQAYQCDCVYGTNSEFGFDYLRDNMKLTVREQVQKRRDFCIVDEVDSILIDEARTPLIISGPAHEDAPRYSMADQIARHLMQKQREWTAADEKVQQCQMKIKGLEGDIRNARDKSKIPVMREQMKQFEEQLPQLESARDRHTQYFELEPERKAAHLTHEGIAEAQKQAGIGSFYVGTNMDFPHLLENALRAHAIYKRDKDYVVQDGEVIIVDEFTGRLMIGRQWSDGLHQAVESKEKVKIKQETQTLATVTIQNFFKLYKRLAGMTGTAITEATEFNEIYKLDVICIPTNVPVIRHDRDDLIFISEKDKWSAILDEIKRIHDIGRPVLVGTTSVEKSETLSNLLTKKHGIQHEVLNAKQHEREGKIIEDAGCLGAVMIATNMAGRGTDIKLQRVDRETLVHHWQQRNLLPREASPEMSDDELVALSYRHQAKTLLGISRKESESLTNGQFELRLLRYWVTQETFHDPDDAAKMDAESCRRALDRIPEYHRHRLEVWRNIEEMGGLHIVGTERHEARRIDNQLRGRAGRQGDRGSSRFFISLEDDLMKLFAGKTTLKALSRLGMKEGDAIEHRWITKSVERAQRKVEERNYEIRKNLLEYDEVMEYQRNTFYGIRQEVLAGRNVTQLIFDYIEEVVDDAVELYMAKDYVQTQIAEWCRQTLEVSIEPGKLGAGSMDDLERTIRDVANGEVAQVIDVTLGEYMSPDIEPEQWDLRGLSQWAMSRFGVDVRTSHLRQMDVRQVKDLLIDAAREKVGKRDLSGLQKFLGSHYGERELCQWAGSKFGVELVPEKLNELGAEGSADEIFKRAKDAYNRREVIYPVEFILEVVFQGAQQDRDWAARQLVGWAKQRYELEWTTEQVMQMDGRKLFDELTEAGEQWLNQGKLESQIDQQLARFGDDADLLIEWFRSRFDQELDREAFEESDDFRAVLVEKGRDALRHELSQLERYVVLQILDQAWKDHLYAMDQLRDSVGLRGYAEKDPRIEYKREGANQFYAMQKTVRDRVTDLIFRAKLTPNIQLRSVYGSQRAEHQSAGSAASSGSSSASGPSMASSAAHAGTDQQQADLAAAEQAGGRSEAGGTRKQRRAAIARQRKESTKQFKKRKGKRR